MDMEKDMELENEEAEYDTISLVDEDGKEQEFQIVDCAEMDEHEYMALLPLFEEPEESIAADGELVVLRVAEDSDDEGDQYLESITDEEEYNKIDAIFRERLSDEFDFVDGE